MTVLSGLAGHGDSEETEPVHPVDKSYGEKYGRRRYISDRTLLENYSTDPFAKDVFGTYFSHLDQEMLNGLSVQRIHKWTPGQAFSWPSRQIHSGTDFGLNDLKSKTYLVARPGLPCI